MKSALRACACQCVTRGSDTVWRISGEKVRREGRHSVGHSHHHPSRLPQVALSATAAGARRSIKLSDDAAMCEHGMAEEVGMNSHHGA